MNFSVYIGFDPREAASFAVARSSLNKHAIAPIRARGLILADLMKAGLYKRPMERRNGRLVDVLSIRPDYDGSISTEHANARFFVPFIADPGWALFCDADILFRANVDMLAKSLDPTKALYCVKHRYQQQPGVKMDSQIQTAYARKNWTSFMIVNVGHEANKRLTLDMVNSLPGRDLHHLCWLDDDEIGELDPAWNWLVGHSDPAIDPKVCHFTEGTPDMPGYEQCPFSDEWRAELERWAR
ncbi:MULTISPECIES: hypothetical protein [unclassified Mesorhizobium]|uniref:hypothetical protein n=1 Tax=unclassified Mesorhizobium TaxID=325217 RepID=UPI000FD7DF1B|nr:MULTISPECIES: hypothetical protein [unclassified Mesorhizobium]TGT76730.1 hypothetical protein EN809_003760 [Mesorhizobium sp. M2E.F.Ca.ET.166.01.1.1]TGW02842.1 hypothetical protein EN797_003760 [Mesorhizobium sp. M2E.F.Ca.ET.154.01.1.1]